MTLSDMGGFDVLVMHEMMAGRWGGEQEASRCCCEMKCGLVQERDHCRGRGTEHFIICVIDIDRAKKRGISSL